ncbi:MAG TPA: HAMP domain-containing sensor histidine kinase [Longimicrobiales bacterium]|nr:HAMP domain-containing sensor histidine kinase [Longimicrobiales bacterium]
MRRRLWPLMLAILSLAILGSYLVYTEYLVREIRAEAAVHTRMYARVQEGLLAVDPQQETDALWALQHEITQMGVPIVVMDLDNQPVAVVNLPFEADLGDEADRERVRAYVRRLDRRNVPIEGPLGTIHYGPPPITSWLRWIPWLQVSGATLLLALAFGLIQVSLRAERERLWAAMARELAHQMGTPLSSLAGWVEVLRLPDAERARLAAADQVAEEISRDVERLERVSRRFELIGKKPRLGPVRVADVVDELDRYLRPRLPTRTHGIALSHRVADDLPAVRGNRVLLVWALENVLKNALDALASRGGGGHIRIAASREDDRHVRVVVSDDGPGIAPEVKDSLFEPGVSTKPDGWGVGLSLTRRIIEDLHGGRVSARERKGGGTTFVVSLEVAEGASGVGRQASETADPRAVAIPTSRPRADTEA